MYKSDKGPFSLSRKEISTKTSMNRKRDAYKLFADILRESDLMEIFSEGEVTSPVQLMYDPSSSSANDFASLSAAAFRQDKGVGRLQAWELLSRAWAAAATTEEEEQMDEENEEGKVVLEESISKQSSHQSHQQDAINWMNEADSWRLVRDLLHLRKQHIQDMEDGAGLSQPPQQQASLHSLFTGDRKCIEDTLKLNLSSSKILEEAQIVKDWLERISPPFSLCEEKTTHLMGTRNHINRQKAGKGLGSLSGGMIGGDVVSVLDPDACSRTGKSLVPDDLNYNQRFNASIFQLFRRGRLPQAIDLCRESKQFWKAASLNGATYYRDMLVDREDHDMEDDDPEVSGNPNFALWKATCFALSKETSLDSWERATYAALAGDFYGVKPVCQTWYDHLWANYNALIESRYLSIVFEHSTVLASNDELALPLPTFELAEEEIFQSLMSESASSNPFHLFQKHFILNSLDAFFESFNRDLKRFQLSTLDTATKFALRFLTHIIITLRNLDIESYPSISNDTILAYIKLLEMEGKGDLIAMYLEFLPEETQISGYSKFLQGVRENRKMFYKLGLESKLDMKSICYNVVESIFRNHSIEMPSFPPEYNEFRYEDLSSPVTPSDIDCIKALEFLQFEEQQANDLLNFGNILSRYYLRVGKVNAVQEVLHTMKGYVDGVDGKEIEDYAQYNSLVACFAQVTKWDLTWRKHHSQPKDEDFLENFKEQTLVARDQISKLIESPLFYAQDTSEELEVIRGLYLPKLVLWLHQILFESRDFFTGHLEESKSLANQVASSNEFYVAFMISNKVPLLIKAIRESAIHSL